MSDIVHYYDTKEIADIISGKRSSDRIETICRKERLSELPVEQLTPNWSKVTCEECLKHHPRHRQRKNNLKKIQNGLQEKM